MQQISVRYTDYCYASLFLIHSQLAKVATTI